jgi:hypothetical protein
MEAVLKKYTGDPQLHFRLIQDHSVAKALNKFIETESIDVMAMLTHRRNFFHELFNYSLAKKRFIIVKYPSLQFQHIRLINQ